MAIQDEIDRMEAERRGRQAYEPADDDGADGAGRHGQKGRDSLFDVEVPDGDYTSKGRFGTRYV